MCFKMQDASLLFLGSIFTIGAFIVYYYGKKKDNNNALLWSLFPLFHGLHEFVDFFSEGNLILMRTEVILAITSSLVLLAVSIEFLGQEHSLYGKLTSLLLLILFSYVLFVMPDDVFSELYNLTFMFGTTINTDFFKSIYGILFIVISLIALIYNLIVVKGENKRTGISTKYYNQIIVATVITMILFVFFEGFSLDKSQPEMAKQIFSLMEAIFGSLFVIFPIIFMAISKPGLNSLIAFSPKDGRFIFAYDFIKNKLVNYEDESINTWINTASFLSALSAFSTTDSSLGGYLSSVNTEKGVFILSRAEKYSLALHTRIATNTLRISLSNLAVKTKSEIEKGLQNPIEVNISPDIQTIIKSEFQRFL